MGAISQIVKQYVPTSYAALISATNSYDYTIDDLQGLADYVQYRLFSTVVDVADEGTIYNIDQQRLLGILTTLQFIPAAVDYWGNTYASVSLTGTNESDSWFDRRPDLWKIFDRLTAEAQALGAQIGINVYAAQGVVPKVSYGDNGRNILVTEDPELWPRLGVTKFVDGSWEINKDKVGP